MFCGESKKALLECMEKGLAREEADCAVLPQSRKGLADARNTLRIMKEVPITVVVLNTDGKSFFEEIDTDSRVTEICDILSIGASIENILLRPEEISLGTLWIVNTCYAYPELTAHLQTEYQLVGAIAVGYAAEKSTQRPRKNLEEVVEFRM